MASDTVSTDALIGDAPAPSDEPVVVAFEPLKGAYRTYAMTLLLLISIGIGFLVGAQVYTAELNVLLAILGIGAVMAGGYAGARQNLKA